MKKTDLKLYKAFLYLMRNRDKVSVSSVARVAGVDRATVYYRLKDEPMLISL